MKIHARMAFLLCAVGLTLSAQLPNPLGLPDPLGLSRPQPRSEARRTAPQVRRHQSIYCQGCRRWHSRHHRHHRRFHGRGDDD